MTHSRIGNVRFKDGYTNVIAALGGNNAKTSANSYLPIIDQRLADNAFRSSTWYSKIINIPADDAVREWRTWLATKGQIAALEAEEKRLKVRSVVRSALAASRHGGGSAIVIGGLPGELDQPLVLSDIKKGSLRFLNVVGRNDLSYSEIEYSPLSQWYGLPKYWTLTTSNEVVNVHPSRIIFVPGQQIPGSVRSRMDVFGDSMWVRMSDAITSVDSSAAAMAFLFLEAKVDILTIEGLTEQLQDDESEQLLMRRVNLASRMKSLSNVILLDGSEKWDQKTINLNGFTDALRVLLEIMCGAADISVARLLQTSAKGLNASGEGDLRNYYDGVRSRQELDYSVILQPLDEMIIRSALGERPETISYEWRPLWVPDPKQLAEIDKIQAETVNIYANNGLIEEEALSTVTTNRLIESGQWPGLEDATRAQEE